MTLSMLYRITGPQQLPRARSSWRLAAALLWLVGAMAAIGDDRTPPVRDTGTEPSAPAEHPLKSAIRVAEGCLGLLKDVQDYECSLTKRERINGQLTTQVMFVRFREEPFSIYCKFGEPFPGREVLYVAVRNNGQMLAHEGTGWKAAFGTVSLPLDGADAKAENRHSLADAGLRNLMKLLIKQWEYESQYGEINVQYYPEAKLGEVPCKVVEVTHPQPRRQFMYHITRLYVDGATGLPVRVENYGWPQQQGGQPVLIEEYTYSRLRTNVGLTDQHFDRGFKEYNF